MELKDRLRDLRARKGLYQKELADRLGVGRSTVAAWETGTKRPEGRTLERVADFFGVSLDYLLGRNELGMRGDVIAVGAGSRLAQFRERAGLTLKDLSFRTDIPVDTLAAYEAGRDIDDEDDYRLCRALGISLGDLYPPYVGDPEQTEPLRATPVEQLLQFLQGKNLTADQVQFIRDLVEVWERRRQTAAK